LAHARAAFLAAASQSARADAEVQALAIATGVVVLAAIVADAPRREEPDAMELEVGRFDAIKNVKPATTFGGEYRAGRFLWWELRPFAGAGFTSQQSLYGYGGIRIATYWGPRIVITPSFAVGVQPRREQGPGQSPGPGPLRNRRRIPPRQRHAGRCGVAPLFRRQSPESEQQSRGRGDWFHFFAAHPLISRRYTAIRHPA